MSRDSLSNEELYKLCKSMRLTPLAEKFIEITSGDDYLKGRVSGRELVTSLLYALKDSRDGNYVRRELARLNLQSGEYTLENMNFKDRKGLSMPQMKELLTCEFIKNRRPLVFTGPTGVGKRWITRHLMVAAVLNHYKCYAAPLFDILADLIGLGEQTVREELNRIASHDLIVINKFGDTELSDEQICLTTRLIESFHGRKSFVLSCQTDLDDWSEVCFKGRREVATIVDYIRSTALIFRLKGDSLRPLYAPMGTAAETENSGSGGMKVMKANGGSMKAVLPFSKAHGKANEGPHESNESKQANESNESSELLSSQSYATSQNEGVGHD